MQYRAWYSRTYLGQVFVSVTILAQGLDLAALAVRERRRSACRAAIAREKLQGKSRSESRTRSGSVSSLRAADLDVVAKRLRQTSCTGHRTRHSDSLTRPAYIGSAARC